jgi:hypothetical protein
MAARAGTHVVAIGAVLAGLVLAGCANASVLDRTPSSEDSLARVQGAAAKVTEAGSARFSMTVRTIFAGEQVAASIATTVGVYDYAAHKGQMDTTVKKAGIPFRFTERTLVIGSAVYLKMPEPPEPPEGPDGGAAIGEGYHKPWVKLELPKEVAGLGGLGPGFGPWPGEGSGDPTQALRYLQAASSKVEVVGAEQVRGVPSTRYAVTFDAAKHAAQVPEELAGLLEESGLAFPRPADVWIDQQGRLRRMHYSVTMKVPGEAASVPMTIETTLELYDFGVEVHVAPPPANQVEVIRPDQPPPGCTHQKGDGRAGSSGGATQDSGQAEAWACVERWGSAEHSGSTSP